MRGQVISLAALLMGALAYGETQTGYVTQVPWSPQNSSYSAQMRTPTGDVTFDTTGMSLQDQATLNDPSSANLPVTISVPDGQVTSNNVYRAGIRADCSEFPMTQKGLEKIITSPKVNNINDFLKAIPPGTFNEYTLVYNSLSAQKGDGDTGVSPMWPRVLRMNADSSIIFSYTCNPASNTYNSVEMLYFDKDQNQVVAKSYKLNQAADTVGPGLRTDPAPTSCRTCHTTGNQIDGDWSLKYNWPEYFFWSDCQATRGISMYGSSDDNMGPTSYRSRIRESTDSYPGCVSSDDQAAHQQELANYQKFKDTQKDNPCYNLLPKPTQQQAKGLDYSYYPYANTAQNSDTDGKNDYSLRTNARITDSLSHLMSRRIATLLKKSPDYDKVKYFLAMEAVGCMKQTDLDKLKKIMPGMKDVPLPNPMSVKGYGGPNFFSPKGTPILYQFSQMAGMHNADWSMEFRPNTDYSDTNYNAVMFKEDLSGESGDFSIKDVVGGEVLRDVGDSDPVVKTASVGAFSSGVTDLFGARHSCIDDLAHGIHDKLKGNPDSPLCKTLRDQNEDHIKDYLAKACANPDISKTASTSDLSNTATEVDKLKDQLKQQQSDDLKASVARGRQLVQDPNGAGHCISCHSRTPDNSAKKPPMFLFFPSDKDDPATRQATLDTFRKRWNAGFGDDVDTKIFMGEMPYDGSLTTPQGKDVMNYIKSLIAGDDPSS